MKKIAIFVGVLFLITIFLNGCSDSITGNVVKDCKCELTTKKAQIEYEVIRDKGGCIIGDCNLEVLVKNKETRPSRVMVEADCTSVNGIKHVSSEVYWMQPNSEYKFSIKVPVGWTEDWKCSNFIVSSDTIYSCQTS